MLSSPGMATSQDAHSAADSFEAGSMARSATSANSTRSTSVVNRRGPSTFRSATSTPSARHNPSSRWVVPIGLDSVTVSPSPTSSTASVGSTAGVGSPEVAVDRGHQPGQPVPVQPVLTAQVDQHLGLGHVLDPAVARQLDVADHRPVLVPPLGGPQVHAHKPTDSAAWDQSRLDDSCAHAFPESQSTRNTLTSTNAAQAVVMCPPTAELGSRRTRGT